MDFQRSIKRNPAAFMTLKHDNQWDAWQRHTAALAATYDVAEVLDPKYSPPNTVEQELFDKKQAFMFAVFNEKLKTDTGQQLVRTHAKTRDASLLDLEDGE